MPIPTRRFALVVVLATVVAAAVGNWWVLIGIDLVLLLVAGADALLGVADANVRIERFLPSVVVLDSSVDVRWEVVNRSNRAVTVTFSDELAPSLRPVARQHRLRLQPGGAEEVMTTITPSRRGRFSMRRLVVRIDGPLGLGSVQRVRSAPRVLRVYPVFRSRDEAELRINRARVLQIGLRSAQGLGSGTEFDQLREYTVDDEFRRIDWAATARSSRAIVRTYRAERNQTVISLLDCGRVMSGRVADVPRLEHAMDAVMMLTTVSTALGDRAGLVAFDHEVRGVVTPGHSRRQLSRVTEAMYDLEPALAESNYRGAFAETLSRFRRRAMLVVFTDLVEQAVAETLLPALPMVTKSHIVVVASVQDPEVVRWALSAPEDAAGAYRKAAAMDALDERRRITGRLRGLGATVVDAPPGELAGRLADAYLQVKATGRL